MTGNDVGVLVFVLVFMFALALPIYEMYRVFFGIDQWSLLAGEYEYDGGGVFLCFAKVPTVRMRISGKAMDALLKAGAPWTIAPDGAIIAKEP